MEIGVTKEDIKKIGYACYNEGGFLAIMCDGDTCNIEEILLRSILKCFGDEYKVIDVKDYVLNEVDEVYDGMIVTNLPYEIYDMIV